MVWEIHEEPREERVNSALHGLGAALALAGLSVMVVRAACHGDAWQVVAVAIFGASLFLLYLASALYHGAVRPRAKAVLEILDHSAIYLLIAGTYTPFALVSLRGPLGWTIFGIAWAMAVGGIVMQVAFPGRYRGLMTLLYIVMGWLAVPAAKPLMAMLPGAALAWVVGGGLFYTLGVYFYYRKRFPFSHAVWHLFVLAGSLCHFIAIFRYVLPAPA
jgi:hemolysin III